MSTDAQRAIRSWFDHAQLSPLGAGHIHDTYLVRTSDDRYVLQRVNEYVFRDGDLVMRQTRQLLSCWQRQNTYVVPDLISALDGSLAVRSDGSLWRVWRFIAGRTIDPIQRPSQIEAVARAFARFQDCLERLPNVFTDTIDGFLNLDHYLEAFAAVEQDAPEDLKRFIGANAHLGSSLKDRHCHIHGDCKVNNVLFDGQGQDVIAVIDFDTAMYGHWAWDFGDLVRSVSFSAGGYDLRKFSACVRGFAGAQSRVTPEQAAVAPAYVALMLGVRFLTDHLQGDPYFKVTNHGDNLDRARAQLSLLKAFLQRRQEMVAATQALLRSGSESR